MINITALVLVIVIGFLVPKAAGHSKAEIVPAIKAAFDNKQLSDLENPLLFRGSQPC
jgi:hypothetical protein